MSNYDYPLLSQAQIISILADAQIAISSADLSHPTPELLSVLYSKILNHLNDFHDDENQLDFSVLESLQNPYHHIDAINKTHFCFKIHRALSSIDCPQDFYLMDIIRPDPKRTRFFISALLNFGLFKDLKYSIYSQKFEEVTLVHDQQRVIEAKILQFNEEIEDFSDARKKLIPAVQEVEASIIELRQSISELNNQQMSLRTMFRQKKEQIQEIDVKLSNAEFAIVEAAQENANLRSKIVHSPEKLMISLKEIKSALDEAKDSERSAIQSCNENSAIVEVYTKALKKMKKHISRFQGAHQQIELAKSSEKEIKVLKSKLSDDEMKRKFLQAKLNELQLEVKHTGDLKKKVNKENDLKLKAASDILESERAEARTKETYFETLKREVDNTFAKVKNICSEMDSRNEAGAAVQQGLLLKGEEIAKAYKEYCQKMAFMFG